MDFYQGLFGMPIAARNGPSTMLRIGAGPQFISIGPVAAGAAPSITINHACMNVDAFMPDAVLKALESFGLKARESAPGPAGPMRHYVTMRMENRGGAPGGTPELYFTDPDGLLMQLQDSSYCGGSGLLGEVCK